MADADVPTLEDLAADLAGDSQETDVKEEPVVAEPTEPESSPEETTDPTDEPSDEEPSEEEASTEEEPEPSEPEERLSPAEERKQQLNTDIRDLVSQRRDLMNEVERLNSQVYAPQSVDDIMDETGQSQAEARITAMEQRQELQAYNTQVAEAQLVIGTESERVLRDFPMFNPDSPDYNPNIASQAASQVAAAIQTDPNTGQITGSNLGIYNYYETLANAMQQTATENQLKGQRAAKQELAAAEPGSSAVPAQPKEDPFLTGLLKGYEGKLGS